jgi:hypothetical protein
MSQIHRRSETNARNSVAQVRVPVQKQKRHSTTAVVPYESQEKGRTDRPLNSQSKSLAANRSA